MRHKSLRLKTYHLFWPNRFFRSLIFFGVGIFLSQIVHSNDIGPKKRVPGIIESLEVLIRNDRTQFIQEYSKLNLKTKTFDSIKDLDKFVITPFFLSSIIFNSEWKYFNLAIGNECRFYSLFQNNLLKKIDWPIEDLAVTYITLDGKVDTILVDKNRFMEEIYKKSCFEQKDLDILYNAENFKKTLTKVKFEVPKTQIKCDEIFKSWLTSPQTPYLCKIPYLLKQGEKMIDLLRSAPDKDLQFQKKWSSLLRDAKFLRDNTDLFQKSYLTNLCDGLEDVANFCQIYLAKDAWTKIVNGELPSYFLTYRCKNYLNQDKISTEDFNKCAEKFKDNSSLCLTKGSTGFSSYYPHQNCNDISEMLNTSNLKTDYQDCPGRVDNEGITNIHRLFMHIKPEVLVSTPETCTNEANYSFAKRNIKESNFKVWPLKICYKDPAQEETVCKTYVPGNNETSKYSEGKVVAEILKRTQGAPEKMVCKIIDANDYKPHLLKYRAGCFIVNNTNECTTFHCPKIIRWNNKVISGITYKGVPLFNYFPTTLSSSDFSATTIIEEAFKIKHKMLSNLTDIYAFLSAKKDNVIHGVGCIEDILPHLFYKRAFNQCRPLPFIVDGYLKKEGTTFLTTHLPIDDVHSPRLINWNNIFNGITSYKRIHPLDTWTMYGISN